MSDIEFRASVVSEFRAKGYSKGIYQDFDELLAAVACLMQICIERFTLEVSRMKAPYDICAFIARYDATNTNIQSKIAFKHLCKSIFSLVPKLRLNSNASSIFPQYGDAHISVIMDIHYYMMELSQFYGILITYQSEVGVLIVSDDDWTFHFIDDFIYNLNCRFQQAVTKGALGKYCDDDFVGESFIDSYRNVFKDVEGKIYERIFNVNFFYDCDNLSEQEFCNIVLGNAPQRGIIDVTDIVINNRDNPCIKGLVFDETHSDLFMALTKPHNRNFRTRFRPFIQIFIDDRQAYLTTQSLYFEAISEIGCGQYAHNELPEEWSNIQELKKSAKNIFKKHSDCLEENIASLLNGNYNYLKNVTSLSNTSCKNAPIIIDGKQIPKKTVGEIDFIIIDDEHKTVYVADAKFLKPTFFYPSFAADADKFRKEGGYEDKLSYKINWVSMNIPLLCRHLKRKDIITYTVKGFFITDNLVYYSLMSKYPIVPISNLITYIKTMDRFCSLPQAI